MTSQSGFTLLELLVVILLVGIVGVMGYPQFFQAYHGSVSEQKAREVYDLILEAREKAIASEACDGQSPQGWSVFFQKNPLEVSLVCFTVSPDETAFATEDQVVLKTISMGGYDEMVSLQTAFETDAFQTKSHGFIHFIPDKIQALILPEDTQIPQQKIHIVWRYSAISRDQGICLEQVQSFPTLNPDGAACLY